MGRGVALLHCRPLLERNCRFLARMDPALVVNQQMRSFVEVFVLFELARHGKTALLLLVWLAFLEQVVLRGRARQRLLLWLTIVLSLVAGRGRHHLLIRATLLERLLLAGCLCHLLSARHLFRGLARTRLHLLLHGLLFRSCFLRGACAGL